MVLHPELDLAIAADQVSEVGCLIDEHGDGLQGLLQCGEKVYGESQSSTMFLHTS